jgi:prophage maintenance system killer protein
MEGSQFSPSVGLSVVAGPLLPTPLTSEFIEWIWRVPARAGGHRSDELRHPAVLERIATFINARQTELEPHVLAGTALYRFCEEQPFGDYNNRTGLILADLLMRRAGFRLARGNDETSDHRNKFATNHPSKSAMIDWIQRSFEPVA